MCRPVLGGNELRTRKAGDQGCALGNIGKWLQTCGKDRTALDSKAEATASKSASWFSKESTEAKSLGAISSTFKTS
jgi:hypothetical protein